MGGVNSYCIPRHRNPNQCKENHTSTPKMKSCKRNLSAAFNITALEKEQAIEQLNINQATEEELMTLPGVNRNTAINIVEYRRKIGGFKKVEDLALVSGVGATKLGQMRMEICVNKKKSSKASSLNNSDQDLTSVADSRVSSSRSAFRLASCPQINLNTANVFQLMKVKGASQQLAENIVSHRDRKGPFQTIDDLVKVKGINSAVLSAIRPYLTIKSENVPHHLTNGHLPNSSPEHHEHNNVHCSETASRISQNSQGSRVTEDDNMSVYGPLSQSSMRRKVKPFTFVNKGRPIVRICSWNLEQCALDKIQNPGVREVVCMTVLENGFSVVAFQELKDKNTLQKICDELNSPTLPSVKKWKGHQGSWQCITSEPSGTSSQSTEFHGFLYDTSRGVGLLNAELLSYKHPDTSVLGFIQPYRGLFKVGSLCFNLISVHLETCEPSEIKSVTDDAQTGSIAPLFNCIEEHLMGEHDVIVAGDFNLPPDNDGFHIFQDSNLSNTVPVSCYTDISPVNLNGSRCHDNIWLSHHPQMFTGHSGVIREGLTSPWIPNGWSWGGTASSHCPVWAELYTQPGELDPANMLPSDLEGISFTVKHLISEM